MLPELHRLLEALKLRYAREAIEDVLRQAQRRKPSYSQFLQDLLSRELEDKRRRVPSPTVLSSAGLQTTGPWRAFPGISKKAWHVSARLSRS